MQGWTSMKHLFDIPFAKRAKNIVNAILDYSPDIVLPAEHHDEWAGVNAGAIDGSVVLVDLLGYDYLVTQNQITYEGETAVNRTPIIYNSKRFQCMDSGFVKLTEEASFQRSCNKRVVTWAILKDVNNSILLAVFNTHWSFAEYKGTSLAEIRQAQTKEMQNLINSERFCEIPKVVGGDFNVVYADPLYGELLQNCCLSDADMTANGRITYNNVDHIAILGAEINAFVSPNVENASDHNPICCDIKIYK